VAPATRGGCDDASEDDEGRGGDPKLGAPLELREVAVPEVGPGQVLIRVRASGVCHTDLHAAEGDWPVKPSPPFIPGHEGVGEVAAVGAGVGI
jgi:alcohol dehydrogenase, propanol-preferring